MDDLLLTPEQLKDKFDRDSVDALVTLKRPYIKIDSGSITDHFFLEHIARQVYLLLFLQGYQQWMKFVKQLQLLKT